VGENAREKRHPGEPVQGERLTNMRSQGDGKGISLAEPLKMSLERGAGIHRPDEYVEATPKNLRLRKKELDETKRKRAAQSRQPKIVENNSCRNTREVNLDIFRRWKSRMAVCAYSAEGESGGSGEATTWKGDIHQGWRYLRNGCQVNQHWIGLANIDVCRKWLVIAG